MKALVLKDISPIIKKGSILIKNRKGQFLLQGHKKPKKIPNDHSFKDDNGMQQTVKYHTANWYPNDIVLEMKDWFKIIK